MSYTEIYKFNSNGDAEFFNEVPNAWRGAMQIWRTLEKKYLPPLPKPSWMDQEDYDRKGYYRYQMPPSLDDNKEHLLKPVWELFGDDKLTREDKIVLGTTFDGVIVMYENLKDVITAFESFDKNHDTETSLKQQADILKEALADDDLIGVGWNQTSINGDAWEKYIDAKDEPIPYNLMNDMEHFDLFEDDVLKK